MQIMHLNLDGIPRTLGLSPAILKKGVALANILLYLHSDTFATSPKQRSGYSFCSFGISSSIELV